MKLIQNQTWLKNEGLDVSLKSNEIRIRVPRIISYYHYDSIIRELEEVSTRYPKSLRWVIELLGTTDMTLSLAAVFLHLKEELKEKGQELRIIEIPKALRQSDNLKKPGTHNLASILPR